MKKSQELYEHKKEAFYQSSLGKKLAFKNITLRPHVRRHDRNKTETHIENNKQFINGNGFR